MKGKILLFSFYLLLFTSSQGFGSFIFNGSTITLTGGVSLRVPGIKINSGGISCGAAKIYVSGDWENNGTFIAGTSTVTFENSAITSTIIVFAPKVFDFVDYLLFPDI